MNRTFICAFKALMDPLYKALSEFRRCNYTKCIELCTDLLEKQPLDQAVWCLKMRAITRSVYVDDLECENVTEGEYLDDVLSTAPRPGTSMKVVSFNATANTTHSSRPRTSTGKPLTGVRRPENLRDNLTIDRLKTSRPLTQQSARAVRLGTSTMFTQKDEPFIQVSRLNVAKYAKNHCLSKPLFEYLFYHEGDFRTALDLAVRATQYCEYKDWWWKMQLAKCYVALNLLRDGQEQLRSALKQQKHVELYLRLSNLYCRLDQPLTVIDICKGGLQVYPNDVSLMTQLARINEALNDTSSSLKYYRNVVIEDAMNVEGIACIGMHHFYSSQPELALRYYRRILSMGVHSAELYNNLGLCCLYSQQLDATMACLMRALELASDDEMKSDIWFNLSYVGIAAGDLELAMQCLNLCISINPSHASAFNNLGVLQHRMNRNNVAKTYFETALNLQQNLMEPQTNLEILQRK